MFHEAIGMVFYYDFFLTAFCLYRISRPLAEWASNAMNVFARYPAPRNGVQKDFAKLYVNMNLIYYIYIYTRNPLTALPALHFLAKYHVIT